MPFNGSPNPIIKHSIFYLHFVYLESMFNHPQKVYGHHICFQAIFVFKYVHYNVKVLLSSPFVFIFCFQCTKESDGNNVVVAFFFVFRLQRTKKGNVSCRCVFFLFFACSATRKAMTTVVTFFFCVVVAAQ